MSARWPGMSRPRSVSRAESAGVDGSAARSARSSVSASSGPNGGVPAGQRGSSRRTASAMPGPRVERLDRRVRPERHDRAGRGERRPRCSRRPRRARPTAGGPCSASEPEVDRLDAGRDPGRRERGRDRPGGGSGRARCAASAGRPAAVGVEDVERGADRGVADRVDLRGDAGRAAARVASSASSSGGVIQTPRRCSGGSGGVRLGLDVLEQGRGPRPERAVGEASSASRPGPGPSGRRRARRRCAGRARSRCRGRRRARRHGRGPAAGPVSARCARPGTSRSGPGRGRAPPGSWQATTPSETRSCPTVSMSASRSAWAGRRDVDRDEARGRLVQDALGRPVGRRAGSTPPDGSSRRGRDVRPSAGRRGWPSSAWWSCAQSDDPAARRDRLEVVGRRPAAPSVGVPAVALEPGVGVRERRVRGRDRRHAVLERRDRR